MRRLLTPLAGVALAALLAFVVVILLVPPPVATQAEQAHRLAAELRCPDCQALSVAESQTAAADAIRAEISEQLAAGRTPAQIRASFIARYGEWILLQPASALVWLIPLVAALAGIGLFGWWLRGGSRSTPSAPPPAPADRQRVRDELDALDG
jgi:cytochrome c-type biogenesis protein CcmH